MGQVNGTGIAAIGWILTGMTVGLALGWLVGLRRLRADKHRFEQEQRAHLERGKAEVNALSCSLRKAKNRIGELETLVPDLEAQLAERSRKVVKLQAQVIDRESTINSLRSRLFGARISASLLEEELESLQHQFIPGGARHTEASDTADSTSNLTISLGGGLEIEATPTE
jgi:chromosome segregation ATPase